MNEPSESAALRSSNRGLPELLLPAGGFDAAIAAFEGGADAIYLGLADFSARKQARNFDDVEYRRILEHARGKDRRVYVAMNTVVTEEELAAIAEKLVFLSRFAPDALIFQDWGLARLVAERFPGLVLHASTQSAIQTDAAVRLAKTAGATRIVLPRETTIVELAERVRSNPDVEFEVFVHGALCYSYSGLCLASGLTLGRSGNRGECAQLCRSWYEGSGALGGEGYWFSCRDLSLVDRLSDIVAAGASSLKIEGRMKSPEYVHAVASLYRGALDRLVGGGPEDSDFERRKEEARVAFSRGPTSGWSGHHGGRDIIDPSFPGHRGARLGSIVEAEGDRLVLDLETGLAMRDGVQVVIEAEAGVRAASLQLSVLDMKEASGGRRLFEAEAGARVVIPIEGLGPRERSLLERGGSVEKISSRAQDRRKSSVEEFPPAIESIDARLLLGGGGEGEARASIEIILPASLAMAEGERLEAAVDVPLKVEKSRQPGSFGKALGIFSESGSLDFRLRMRSEGSVFLSADYVGPAVEELFIPPSALKRFKNAAYEGIATLMRSRSSAVAEAAIEAAKTLPGGYRSPVLPTPPRASIVFPDPRIEGGMPYATPALLAAGTELPEIGGWLWLPLAPLVLSTEAYFQLAHERIIQELRSGRRLALGIDAIHHLAFAAELLASLADDESRDRLAFWIDIHLYVANSSTLAFLVDRLDGIAFAYSWIEAREPPMAMAPMAGGGQAGRTVNPRYPAIVDAGGSFNAPLFLSKACLIRQHLGKGHCPVPCGKRMAAPLRDRERSYVAIVEDCISMLFRAPAS
ncbi:MAG TPA: peptidase U32 family protein [Rectinemataceae bacterium]|nr:peptidase U32 family protein [Rectinemataceae bacterium]